jgi:hypothetical protein
MMNPDVKKRWVAALRSGEYVQGVRALKRRTESGGLEYCCLGVLCDLAARDGVCTEQIKGAAVLYDTCRTFMPDSVVEWAGLSGCDPGILAVPNAVFAESKLMPFDKPISLPLSYLNDKDVPFERIATFIEEQL